MVIALPVLLQMINARKHKVLLMAEASMPPHQYRAYRKLFLCEFGDKGLEGELYKIYTESQQQRKGRE